MMERELKQKLSQELPITVGEALRLDEALETQASVRDMVASLKDPSPSMEWRSRLNERLAQVGVRQRRVWSLKWATGLSVAAAGILVVVISTRHASNLGTGSVNSRTPVASNKGNNVEELLFTAHQEADIESGLGVTTQPVAFVRSGS